MVYRLSSDERERFESALESVPEGLRYVVLRNYSNLPKSVPGVDIDILVDSSRTEELIRIFKQYGFGKYGSVYTRYRSLIKRFAFSPMKTTSYLFNNPKKFAGTVIKLNTELYTWGKENFEMVKIQYDDLEIDFYNHLAHKSPTNNNFLNRTMIRIDPRVEQAMLNNRIKYENFYIPSPPDELVHMLCRGVFDHDGTFRKYYKRRCNELYETVIDDKEYSEQYEKHLDKIFFDCSGVVDECVSEGRYDDIIQEVLTSTEY